MKLRHYFVLLVGVLILSLVCIPPIFIGRYGDGLLLFTLVFFLVGTPIFLFINQLISTLSFMLASFLTNQKIIYSYFCTYLSFDNVHIPCFLFLQFFGLSPAIYLEDRGSTKYRGYFQVYTTIFFTFQSLLFILGVHLLDFRGSLLPLLPFSLLTFFHTGFFLKEYRNFYRYKSRILTALVRKEDQIHLKEFWDESVLGNKDLVYQLLCYLILIKSRLNREEVEAIESLEKSYFENIENSREHYSFLDTIKINLYMQRENKEEYRIYKKILDSWTGERPYYYLLVDEIYRNIELENKLDLSLAVSELPIILDVLK